MSYLYAMLKNYSELDKIYDIMIISELFCTPLQNQVIVEGKYMI